MAVSTIYVHVNNLSYFIISVEVVTDGGKDIAFGDYGPTWRLHRKIAAKAMRYFTGVGYITRSVTPTLAQGQ